MRLAFDARFKVEGATVFGPVHLRRNHIEIIRGKTRGTAARRRCQPDFRMLLFACSADEGDGLAVGRPARTAIAFRVIGNLQQLAGRSNHPHIRVAVVFILFARAVRDESDLHPIRRPLRIIVVPVIARGDHAGLAGLYTRDPDVTAAIIEPAGVVELVGKGFVMPHIAVVFVTGAIVARPGAAHTGEPRPIGRPLKAVDAVLEISDAARFAAVHRQDVDLRARIGRRAFGRRT